MLRALILLLLLANGLFFAWTRGALDAVVGVRSIGDREPERLQRQVRPEVIRILPPESASAPESAASSAPASAPASAPESAPASEPSSVSGSGSGSASAASACLEAGPYTDTELTAAQAAAQAALPPGSWVVVRSEQAGEWIVYMGRYANREALVKKADELRRRRLPYEEIATLPNLSPGLSLGRFDQRSAAAQALERFSQQGIRTARVVELAPAVGHSVLRVGKADPPLAARVMALGSGAAGKRFAACAGPLGG